MSDLKDQLFQDVPESERSKMLRDNCDKLEEISYQEVFSDEQLIGFRHELGQNVLKLDDLEEEKKAFMAELKIRMEPLKTRQKELKKFIRHKSQSIKKECFALYDHTTFEVGYYNAKGIRVDKRAMVPEEKQAFIAFRKSA